MPDSAMAKYVEFYIGCNPPLLPNGVQHVVRGVTAAVRPLLQQNETFEILYEPDVPWFKCISPLKHQTTLTNAVQDTMTGILESETGLINMESRNIDAKNFLEFEALPDVAILSTEPRVIPWLVCEATKALDANLYHDFRYPNILQTMDCHKAIWRGLEAHPGLTLTMMLKTLQRVWPHIIEFEDDTEKTLEKILGCINSTNLAANLVYIGCDPAIGDLEVAVQKLNTMLQVYTSISSIIPHMFLVADDPTRFVWKTLTAVGLSHKTYLQGGSLVARKLYQALKDATTLRTSIENDAGEWLPDATSYHSHPVTNDGVIQPFSVFMDHNYPNNQRSIGYGFTAANSENDNVPNLMDEPIPETQTFEIPISFGINHSLTPTTMALVSTAPQSQALIELGDSTSRQFNGPSHIVSEEEQDIVRTETTYHANDSAPTGPTKSSLRNGHAMKVAGRLLSKPPYDNGFSLEYFEDQVGKLVDILKLAHGYAALELKLGRIFIEGINPPPSKDGSSPPLKLEQVSEILGAINVTSRFSSVLSISGNDADLLSRTKSYGEARWKLAATDSIYAFKCAVDKTAFNIEIDANRPYPECKLPEEELAGIYLHCPRQAWDIKAAAFRSQNLEMLQGYEKHVIFAYALRESLRVATDDKGELVLQIGEETQQNYGVEFSGAAIKHVIVKQVARYTDDCNGETMLKITRHQELKRMPATPSNMASFKTIDNSVKTKKIVPGNPRQWFEASVSSVRFQTLLSQNKNLQTGEIATWSSEATQMEGMFRSVCGTGIEIITQIDAIGQGNDNGLEMAQGKESTTGVVGLQSPQAIVMGLGKDGDQDFW
ncbi:hypothetical protein HJFPF1_00795 [Paramyrothecium foliicola]|nr:hypothetical protein HJFPF1_00795 [Paramyrothecium foliicola]